MYPKRVKLFIPWSKAMVAGATVDKPSYSKKSGNRAHRRRRVSASRRRRSRAKKE